MSTTTNHRRLSKTQTLITTFKEQYENYEGGISEYVTMLIMNPCTDFGYLNASVVFLQFGELWETLAPILVIQ